METLVTGGFALPIYTLKPLAPDAPHGFPKEARDHCRVTEGRGLMAPLEGDTRTGEEAGLGTQLEPMVREFWDEVALAKPLALVTHHCRVEICENEVLYEVVEPAMVYTCTAPDVMF